MTTINTTSDAPSVIPTPPDFSVAWARPEDAQLFWMLDPMHFPDPMLPLEFSVFDHAFQYGFNAAGATYDAPIGAQLRRINTFFYQAMGPLPLPPEELERRGTARRSGSGRSWRASPSSGATNGSPSSPATSPTGVRLTYAARRCHS